AAEAVRDQFLLLDPAANTAGRDAKGIGDLIDRVEFCRFHLLLHCIAKARTAVRRPRMTPAKDSAERDVGHLPDARSGLRTLEQNWSSLVLAAIARAPFLQHGEIRLG